MFFDSIVIFHVAVLADILRDQHRLTALVNRVLRRIFGPKRDEVNYILRILMVCIPHQILFGLSKLEK